MYIINSKFSWYTSGKIQEVCIAKLLSCIILRKLLKKGEDDIFVNISKLTAVSGPFKDN